MIKNFENWLCASIFVLAVLPTTIALAAMFDRYGRRITEVFQNYPAAILGKWSVRTAADLDSLRVKKHSEQQSAETMDGALATLPLKDQVIEIARDNTMAPRSVSRSLAFFYPIKFTLYAPFPDNFCMSIYWRKFCSNGKPQEGTIVLDAYSLVHARQTAPGKAHVLGYYLLWDNDTRVLYFSISDKRLSPFTPFALRDEEKKFLPMLTRVR
jgi:hypothetical protein